MTSRIPVFSILPKSKIKITFFSSSDEEIYRVTLVNECSEPISIPANCPIEYERFETERMPLLIE
ncbi:hypothetical protein V7183_10165 [Bacillus sp. JJ1127]|uniref:hypothetical protein n=1 Tax=Bacillus sp. JJ1127 TaxID=3122952 RepID=UPI002FFE5414